MPLPEIPSVLEFLGQPLLDQLDAEAEPTAVPGLRVGPGLRAAYPQLLTDEALAFIVALAERTRPALNRVLAQRRADRAWLDAETLALAPGNTGRDFSSSAWQTVIGRATPEGRVLVGPLPPQPAQPVQVPAWLAGDQVTLFGPPDSKRLSINAMNALHRRLPEEPPIVARLVDESGQVPRWGADDEDSKTPLALDLLAACDNLLACFDGSLSFTDPASGREYRLATERRARPVKRIPGLELPDTRLLLRGCPLPLHLSDLALHAWHARSRPEALTFYVPKLENEGEAEYLRQLLGTCEELLRQAEPDLAPGTLRVILVFENPRAIFRVREMAQALHPHFVGGSLGWHDFLASTARLFRHDPGYRIPVKADPDIVIRHIKESHLLLAHTLGPLGALRIGGMYGVLYEDGNPRSFALSMVGYIRDVVTQLRRGLDGFWVAHPAFVRVGIALVRAWRRREADPGDPALAELVQALLPEPRDHTPVLRFIEGPDVPGLSEDDPRYLRGVLAADLPASEVLPNHDPEEVRYNVFQALQYLADWLCGNGCVALPAALRDPSGEPVFVRVMDDLATTERSRWELWAEVHHGRVPRALFERIFAEELAFLQADQDSPTHRIQVRWQGEAARWYPIAARILRQLVTDPEPVEFVPQLLMPFTTTPVREAPDPWAAACALNPGRYTE